MAKQNDAPQVRPEDRLQSLDAYRGLIMISLAFVGFGLAETAQNFLEEDPSSAAWQAIHYQFTHTQWAGCSYWDLIQPSFMFMVGVSMAYSYAKRRGMGHSYGRMFLSAIRRALTLILLSIFLISIWSDRTEWSFMNVLAQMGLAYPFLFLLWGRPFHIQASTAFVILLLTWILYEAYPQAGIDLSRGAPEVGVSQEWAEENLQGIRPAWHKNANVGHAVDLWFLNLFPREEPFRFNQGGYQTINFIPSLVTMLFGLMCGELLRSPIPAPFKWRRLLYSGLAGLAIGYIIALTGLCPNVKRIWTPTWTLFSTGWCCLILAALYGIIDLLKWQKWAFPLIVVGMNSIAIYCMSMTMKPFIADQLKTHFGSEIFSLYGSLPAEVLPSVQATMVGMVLWLVCYYLYRQRVFLRL